MSNDAQMTGLPQNARAQAKADKAYKKAARPWFKKKRYWLIAIIVLFIAIGIGSQGGDDEAPATASTTSQPAAEPTTEEAQPEAPAEETTAPPEPEAAPAEEAAPEAPALTLGQQNAVDKANAYLDLTGFSRSGLIQQLEFEGFSTEDASFAVDSIAPDWNAQAAIKAQSYLDLSGFSRQGLIDQLTFEGFSQAEAEAGVTAVGY